MASPKTAKTEKRAPVASAERATETLFGVRALLAVLAVRERDIVRVSYSARAAEFVAPLIAWCEKGGVQCEQVDDARIERITHSPHHEGVCMLVRERKYTSVAQLGDRLVNGRGTAVALDRVRNAHNVGAILRSAAFFGVDAALLGSQAPHPALSADAVRVAEGGVEHLAIARTTDLVETLSRLRVRGVRVVGAAIEGGSVLKGFSFERPTVLVVGHERDGISERVRAVCDHCVTINGAGDVESLNVSVAAGVLLASLVRAK